MIGFTRQERRILFFLVAALLAGSIVSLIRQRFSKPLPEISVISPEPSEEIAQADSFSLNVEPKDSPERVDINTATCEQLQSLPGIGPQMARRIVEFRDLHGAFSSVQEITAVRGIGQKTFLRLRDRILADSTGMPVQK
jgi:comEA protein